MHGYELAHFLAARALVGIAAPERKRPGIFDAKREIAAPIARSIVHDLGVRVEIRIGRLRQIAAGPRRDRVPALIVEIGLIGRLVGERHIGGVIGVVAHLDRDAGPAAVSALLGMGGRRKAQPDGRADRHGG